MNKKEGHKTTASAQTAEITKSVTASPSDIGCMNRSGSNLDERHLAGRLRIFHLQKWRQLQVEVVL